MASCVWVETAKCHKEKMPKAGDRRRMGASISFGSENLETERFNSQIVISFCSWESSRKMEVCRQQVGPNGNVLNKKQQTNQVIRRNDFP